jgi:hypothetical protein
LTALAVKRNTGHMSQARSWQPRRLYGNVLTCYYTETA